MEDKIREVLDRLRPYLQRDGGDVELVGVEGKSAKVRLVGACGMCPSSTYTLKMGLEQAIRDEIPEFEELIQVE